MKVFLFGATGRTGKEILTKLLEQKQQVFVLARNPDALDIADDNLNIIKGNIFNPETYQTELSECDLVIAALGTGSSRKPTDIYSKGGQQIIMVMQKANVKRLITLTAAAFDPTDPATQSFIVKYIVQPLFKHIYSDMQQWEAILANNKDTIDWMIIRPTRLLNGNERGSYRIQLNHCPKGGDKINRKDLAHFIVKQISSNEFIHQKIAIAY